MKRERTPHGSNSEWSKGVAKHITINGLDFMETILYLQKMFRISTGTQNLDELLENTQLGVTYLKTFEFLFLKEILLFSSFLTAFQFFIE